MRCKLLLYLLRIISQIVQIAVRSFEASDLVYLKFYCFVQVYNIYSRQMVAVTGYTNHCFWVEQRAANQILPLLSLCIWSRCSANKSTSTFYWRQIQYCYKGKMYLPLCVNQMPAATVIWRTNTRMPSFRLFDKPLRDKKTWRNKIPWNLRDIRVTLKREIVISKQQCYKNISYTQAIKVHRYSAYTLE